MPNFSITFKAPRKKPGQPIEYVVMNSASTKQEAIASAKLQAEREGFYGYVFKSCREETTNG